MSAHSLRSTAEALGAVLSGRPLKKMDICPACDGAGCIEEPGFYQIHIGGDVFTRSEQCITCDGLGEIEADDEEAMPPDTCPHCDGAGYVSGPLGILFHACPDCDGAGVMPEEPDPSPEERAAVESRLAAWDERFERVRDDIDYPEVE